MERDEHGKNAKIENHIWEIAKILNKNEHIELKTIENAKSAILKILKK
ncbi:hypothetical protein OAQ30_03075 [Nitrosopumilus sp.]|jgi:hypothetical protein|nr:hypothetical protein [Nitrosopumilus sp.]|tara:strand:+ start:2015 stop:2158 length:144 start_codon:yes stop_codon:yes gene_type:complete